MFLFSKGWLQWHFLFLVLLKEVWTGEDREYLFISGVIKGMRKQSEFKICFSNPTGGRDSMGWGRRKRGALNVGA